MHQKNSSALKLFASFLILMLSLSMLLIFQNNQNTILENDQFQIYMILATIGSALLLSLLYFVSKPHPEAKSSKKSSKKKK
jgi:Na+/melibiose symporter-like transporter